MKLTTSASALSSVIPVSALTSISPPSDVTLPLMVTDPSLDVRVTLSLSPVVEICPVVAVVDRLPPDATIITVSDAETLSKFVPPIVTRPTVRSPAMSSISIRSSVVPATALTVATSSPNAVPAVPIDPPAWKVNAPAPAFTLTSLTAAVLMMSPVEVSRTFDVVKSTSVLKLIDVAVTLVASASEPITMLPPAAEISAISAADSSRTSLTVVAADPRSTASALSDFRTTIAAPAFTPS